MNLHEFYLSLKNRLDYPLRQLIHWQLPGLSIRNEPKERLFQHLSLARRTNAEKKEELYRRQFHLDFLYRQSTREFYRINLYYLDLLVEAHSYTSTGFTSSLEAVDIGTSDWFYVQALQAFYSYWESESSRETLLIGYESDAYRIYSDYHSRFDHAIANIGNLKNTHFVTHPFTLQPDHFNAITIFFPFIFLKDHLSWGLLKKSFSPGECISNAWSSLKTGGLLLITNQGKEEFERQKRIMDEVNIPIHHSFQFSSDFYQYPIDHFVVLARKE